MGSRKQEEWQRADARVLGQILAAQNIVFTLPNTTRITEFYAQTLISIPGIAACRVCLGDKSAQAGEMENSVCAECEIFHSTTGEDSPFSPANSNFKCDLADHPDIHFIAIASFRHHFGFFVLKIKDAVIFEIYHPFIINLSNYLAITLENRWQTDLLQKARAELECKVEERTRDLTVANEELAASRLVALDMMQDAVEARQQAEQANVGLQREVAHRKHAEEALREQYSTLRGIIDSTNAIIFSVDRQYRYTSFNQAHATVMQAFYGAEIEIGQSLLEYMTVAEDREAAKRNLDRALAGEQLVEESYSGKGPRSRRYFQVSHSPVRTETGEMIGVAVLAQDITERREMEQALAVREQEYRTLVEHSPDLIVRYDTALRRIYVNPAWEKASGLSAEEVINVPSAEIPKVLKPTVTEYVEKLQEVLKIGNPQSIEFTWVNAYDVTLYLEYVIVPEYDQYGEITSVLSVGRDLTERKRAEEALRESEEKYRSLIHKVQTAILLHDRQGRVLASNPLAQHLLGLSEDHLLGKTLDEPGWHFLREDGSPMPVSEYPVSIVLLSQQSLQGYVAGIVHPDGPIWVLINAEPEFTNTGEIIRVIVSFIDITEKKRAEETLRKLSRAVEQSSVSIIITDTAGAIEYVNPRFTELTGYAAEEVLGQNARFLKSGMTSPEEYRILWKTILSGNVWQGEFCNRKKNGELYWEWASISPVIDRIGTITNFVAAKENITERKNAEQELERYREHLEELVAERTAELQAANEQLQVLSRVKDEFVSNVSHELRTPITNLKLRHHLLAARPDRWEGHLAVMTRETQRLEQIIESLLYLSRLDQKRVDWNPKLVDLNHLVSEFIRDRTALAQSGELNLSFTGEPDLPLVEADVALWEQALSILLTNAFNYTPAGGQIGVRTQVREREGRHWVGVSVSDTGPGISPDEQSHLFERFFRGTAGRESGAPGTGLGLSIVREIVNKHHGQVEVISDGVPGNGTTFSLWLLTAESAGEKRQTPEV